MTMWFGNRKEDGESSNNKTFPGKMLRNKLLGKDSPKTDKESSMRLAETFSGIEVSLSNDGTAKKYQHDDLQTMSSTPTDSSFSTVISLKEQLDELRKPHFVKFQMPESPQNSPKPVVEPLSSFFVKPRHHRIPLFRSKLLDKASYESVFHLLRGQNVGTELTLVRTEISLLDKELEALQEDRNLIDKNAAASPTKKNKVSAEDMDVNRQLLVVGSPKRVSSQIRNTLQEDRGLCLTVRIRNDKTLDALLSRTAFRMGGSLSPKRRSPAKNRSSEVMLISPDLCREGGAASTIQHLTLLKLPGAKEDSAFFMSRDNGKSYCSGSLPDHLQRRMKDSTLDIKDLLYIAVGPHSGYYYVQFRSGECWWSGSRRDVEFESICRQWDIHRVVFGGSTVFDAGSTSKVAVSWVVIGRDGKVAWKNIPRRLQSIFESAKAPPSEISLGTNGSFFCKFLDGTMEWQLPAKTAEVCERLEREGSTIMSVTLSPDVTQDFIIRHR